MKHTEMFAVIFAEVLRFQEQILIAASLSAAGIFWLLLLRFVLVEVSHGFCRDCWLLNVFRAYRQP